MTRHRLTRSAALGLALAALAAPAASAQQQDLRSPDTRDAAQAAQAAQDLRSPDTRDAAEGRSTHNSPQVVIVRAQPQPAPADGLDWADAGIGAGTLAGLGLIGLGGALFIVHRRRTAHDAPPVAGL
jgi:hypothetical protein